MQSIALPKSVVRIETIGGLERVSDVQFGAGPTTGLIIDPEGYVVSSAFGFSNKPASIFVRLPDGTRNRQNSWRPITFA